MKPRAKKKVRASLVACYIRVSTVGQNAKGQKAEITRWLEGNGIDPSTVRWFTDTDTGDDLNRTGFDRLQKSIFMGEVGTVVVWKLDRLSRTIRDGLNVLCDWCDRGLRVVSVTQAIDFNGTVGKMIASVLFGIAEMEQATRRERQAAGIAVAKSEGKYQGRKPGTTKAKPKRALKLKEKGLSADEIAKSLGVGRATVFRYFRQAAE